MLNTPGETADGNEDIKIDQDVFNNLGDKIDSKQRGTMSKSLMYVKLLSEQEINRVKDKFNEDTDNVLEEAIRKHVSIYFCDLTYVCLAQCFVRKCSNVVLRIICVLCIR